MKLTRTILHAIHGIIWPFTAIRTSIEGYSMLPTLHPGELLLFDRLCYTTVFLKRSDIIMIRNAWNTQRDYIKRIVGIPGDTVILKGNVLTINETIYTWPLSHSSDTLQESFWTLGENDYFLLGDNLEYSTDSRSNGPINLDSILGRARMVYWPLSRTRTLD